MRATTDSTSRLTDRKSFPISDLMEYIGCGRNTAEKIGKAAGARFTVGRRVLYKRDKIDAYIDGMNESGVE